MPNAAPPRSIIVAPSILSADFGRLAEEGRAVDAAGADWIHVDVMDGRFVRNITIGLPSSRSEADKIVKAPEKRSRRAGMPIVVGAAIFGSSYYAAPIAAVRQRPRRSARKARS